MLFLFISCFVKIININYCFGVKMAVSLDDWKEQSISECDVAVVGTSPIPVMDAIYYCLRGRKVVLLEKRATPGGAWGGTSVCGIDDVDIGSHDKCIDRLNAQFLKKYFDIECIDIKGDGYHFLPKGGCAQMTKRLIAIAQNAGVVLKMHCQLESVQIKDDGCLLEYTDLTHLQSFRMRAKKVVKPSFTAFKILQHGPLVSLTNQLFRKNHLYFIVEDGSCSQNYFLEDVELGGCSRISNLTRFVPLQGANQRMFVAELEESASFFHAISADTIKMLCGKVVGQLKKLGYLSSEAEMIAWDGREFTYQYCKPALKKADQFEQIDTFLIEDMQRCRCAFTAAGDLLLHSARACIPASASQNAEIAPSPVDKESAAESAVA